MHVGLFGAAINVLEKVTVFHRSEQEQLYKNLWKKKTKKRAINDPAQDRIENHQTFKNPFCAEAVKDKGVCLPKNRRVTTLGGIESVLQGSRKMQGCLVGNSTD